ncbi:MAG TPA: threonine synthase [Planctomycetota bacterium]|nr:threonine synthase [Planctomycetota bacterium]
MSSFATHLEAPLDGTRLDHRVLQTVHAGRPLLVRYDMQAVQRAVSREQIARRAPTLWRYRELLPVEDERHIVSLGEGCSPLVRCERLGGRLGLDDLWIKDESQLPTGSFKARGLCMAISRARELGVARVAIPTAGNAGGAMAAYAARAGLQAWVFMPVDTPLVNRLECELVGARVVLVDGLIGDCGALLRSGTEVMQWFDCSTLREPYRIEGKKTMGLELAEQLGWRLPDTIFYPTGGGTGLIGMWKAFDELAQLGWIEAERRPRLFACQAEGCAPIVRAFERGERFAEPVANPHTSASGLRVPSALGDFLILDAVRASHGAACAASEASLARWMRTVAALEGIALCPESAACVDVLARLVERREVRRHERTVIFNTGAAQKYVEVLGASEPAERIVLRPGEAVDWKRLAEQLAP